MIGATTKSIDQVWVLTYSSFCFWSNQLKFLPLAEHGAAPLKNQTEI